MSGCKETFSESEIFFYGVKNSDIITARFQIENQQSNSVSNSVIQCMNKQFQPTGAAEMYHM